MACSQRASVSPAPTFSARKPHKTPIRSSSSFLLVIRHGEVFSGCLRVRLLGQFAQEVIGEIEVTLGASKATSAPGPPSFIKAPMLASPLPTK